MRIGQKNKLTYRWATKGSRPRAPHDQRTESTYLFSAFDDIVDHCCYAWNMLIDQSWKIMTVARRDWATVGCSI